MVAAGCGQKGGPPHTQAGAVLSAPVLETTAVEVAAHGRPEVRDTTSERDADRDPPAASPPEVNKKDLHAQAKTRSPVEGEKRKPPQDPTGSRRAAASPTPHVVLLPSHSSATGPANAGRAILRGDRQLDGGCMWLEWTDGPVAVLWPQGWRAAFSSSPASEAILQNRDGEDVAEAGDEVVVGGYWEKPGRLDRCHIGDGTVMYVSSIETAAVGSTGTSTDKATD